MTYHLAIDIGASSGRHILGHLENGRLVLEEVYRFDNSQIRKDGHDCWDTVALARHVLQGLVKCRESGKIPATVGIDTWGVDFILLRDIGLPCSDMVAYRDARTQGQDAAVEALVSPDDLYASTGIQKQPFNTLYQLMALKAEHPDQLARAARFLMVPDYLNFVLTGKMVNEYTNATTTGLVDAKACTWNRDLLARLGLPEAIFGELAMPGTDLGGFTSAVRDAVGFDAHVVLPATHDTGSAFLAVPARNDRAVFLSSGTWSLLGVENPSPITTPASRAANFTNEGGAWRRYRYLKNIMGLWMIQSIRRELNGVDYVAGKAADHTWKLTDHEPGRKYSFDDLAAAAQAAAAFPGRVNPDDPRFLAPASMIAAVQSAADRAPTTVGELLQCVYASLARTYADAIAQLSRLTGRTFTSLNIVGGGSQDAYLNALTQAATGLPVYAGPTEGTAIGNLLVQFIAGGELADLAAARACVARSFPVVAIGTAADAAEKLFRSGCSCAQAVFVPFAEKLGLDRATALKVASGLGGGVGRLRETCGCVTGAALALGLRYGDAEKSAVYAKVQELAAAFKAEYGSVICRELLAGVPNTTTGGAPEARTPAYYKKRPCAEMVRHTAELLEPLVNPA